MEKNQQSITDTIVPEITPADTSFMNVLVISITNEEDKEFEKKGYKYIQQEQGMYQFDINQSGWYNIDVLIGDPATQKVRLFAKLQQSENFDMNVYLCIPRRKILMGADMHNDTNYIFHYSDSNGYLSLILNDDAFIFATATVKDKIYYGITKFRVQEKQTITITVKESTKENIIKAFKDNQLDSIKLDIDKKEMEIRKRPCVRESLQADTIAKLVELY